MTIAQKYADALAAAGTEEAKLTIRQSARNNGLERLGNSRWKFIDYSIINLKTGEVEAVPAVLWSTPEGEAAYQQALKDSYNRGRRDAHAEIAERLGLT